MLTDSQEALAREVLIHGPIVAQRARQPTRASRPRVSRGWPSRSSTAGLFVELDDGVRRRRSGGPCARSTSRPAWARFAGVKVTGDALHAVLTDVRARLLAEREAPSTASRPGRRRGRARRDDLASSRRSRRPARRRRRQPRRRRRRGRPRRVRRRSSDWADVTSGPRSEAARRHPGHRRERRRRARRGGALVRRGARASRVLRHHDRRRRRLRARRPWRGRAHARGGRRPRRAHPARPHRARCAPTGHRGCSTAILTSVGHVRSGAGGPRASGRLRRGAALAAQGDPAATAVVDAAARGLGRLIALAANLTMQPDGRARRRGHRAVGSGRATASARRPPPSATRSPSPIEILVDDAGFRAWARGAAAVAIQAAVARLGTDL